MSAAGDGLGDHALEVLGWTEVARALAASCATSAGTRTAEALRPDLTLAEARACLAECDEMRELLPDAPPVAGVRDVAAVLGQAGRGRVLAPSDLADVARTAEALARLRAFLLERHQRGPRLAQRAARMVEAPELIAAIDRAVDERGELREDASPLLADLHRRKARLAARIEQALDALRRDPAVAEALSDDFVTLREGRRVLPVRTDRRARVPGILHARSASGRSLFIEPAEVVEINNDLRAAEMEIETEVERILRELSGSVARRSPELADSLAEHVAIDLARARALLAQRLEATTPELGDDGPVDLKALAHPLLLLMAARDGQPGRVVVNDVRLDDEEPGLVITGPNTGGKTVLLKAVGLAVLMARAGLPACAAAGARVPLLPVFADIGDEQSLERSLSSFSAHVQTLNAILAACEASDRPALVLLDEVMAGTDPREGAALARAVLERLAQLRARVIVTTHLGDLKAFAAEHASYRNAGMEHDPRTLRPTYRLRLDSPGASAALAMAERLGMPASVVARARELAGTETLRAEALLSQLEEARDDAVRARQAAEREMAEARRLEQRASRRLEELERADAAARLREREVFERELAALREEAAGITRQLQARPTLPASVEAVRRLDDLRGRLRAAGPFAGSAPGTVEGPLEEGDEVRARSLGRSGRILEGPDQHDRYRVAVGAVTVQLPRSDLERTGRAAAPRRMRPAPAPGPRSEPEAESAVPFTPQSPATTCDLRGMRVEEALTRVERFLEEARAAGERSVLIIHGHGTGALKAAVRERLRDAPAAGAFRPGGAGEGGDGVTVIALR